MCSVVSLLYYFFVYVDVIGLLNGISSEREYVRDGKVTKMIVVELVEESCPSYCFARFCQSCP